MHSQLIISGGHIIDGSGGLSKHADIAIDDGRITGVGDFSKIETTSRVSVGGLCVAPGFIDVHTHDDCLLLSSPDMMPKISQVELLREIVVSHWLH